MRITQQEKRMILDSRKRNLTTGGAKDVVVEFSIYDDDEDSEVTQQVGIAFERLGENIIDGLPDADLFIDSNFNRPMAVDFYKTARGNAIVVTEDTGIVGVYCLKKHAGFVEKFLKRVVTRDMLSKNMKRDSAIANMLYVMERY